MNSRDLCLVRHIPELVEAGINSFKIEGRMKSVHYVAGVVKAYREAIDACCKGKVGCRNDPEAWFEEISKVSHGEYTTGFLFGKPGAEGQYYHSDIYRRRYLFAGLVRGYDPQRGMAVVEQRNRFAVGDEVEILAPLREPLKLTVGAIYDEGGRSIEAAPHPQQIVKIPVPEELPEYSMLRKPLHQ